MELERRILERLLPAGWFARIDIETTTIRRFLQRAAGELPPGAMVLDAGAGRCQYRPLFRNQRYFAVDFARGEAAWDYSSLDIIGSLEALPFADASFDVVVCTQVLEHVPEPAETLRELRRVLRPGGKLLLTAPQAFGEHQEPYDYYRYTSFGLRHLLEKSGFRVESIEPRGGFFWFMSAMTILCYYRLFPRRLPRWAHWMLAPLRLIALIILLVVLPQILYLMDPLDARKDVTLGYACVALSPKPAR